MAMAFEGWGLLKWLEPDEFYAGAWTLVETAEGDDGEMYDIVREVTNEIPADVRYTSI